MVQYRYATKIIATGGNAEAFFGFLLEEERSRLDFVLNNPGQDTKIGAERILSDLYKERISELEAAAKGEGKVDVNEVSYGGLTYSIKENEAGGYVLTPIHIGNARREFIVSLLPNLIESLLHHGFDLHIDTPKLERVQNSS